MIDDLPFTSRIDPLDNQNFAATLQRSAQNVATRVPRLHTEGSPSAGIVQSSQQHSYVAGQSSVDTLRQVGRVTKRCRRSQTIVDGAATDCRAEERDIHNAIVGNRHASDPSAHDRRLVVDEVAEKRASFVHRWTDGDRQRD